MAEVVVTNHGRQRVKDRLGLSKKIAEKNAEKALQFGVTHAETGGKLHRHLDGIFLLNYAPNNMRVYNHSIYLFHGRTLITILPLPNRFHTYADKLQKKKAGQQTTANQEGCV